jgi:hypothetical protein
MSGTRTTRPDPDGGNAASPRESLFADRARKGGL